MFGNTTTNDSDRLQSAFGEIKDELFNFKNITRYFHHKDCTSSYHTLKENTCNDLDFEELFMFVDRTSSKVGQQYLYTKLRTVPSNSEHLALDEKIIQEFTQNISLRIETQRLLEKLKHEDAYNLSTLFQEEHIKPPKWFYLVWILSLSSFISLLLIFKSPIFFLLFLGVIITNLCIHYWNKKNLYQYLGSIPQLLRLKKVAGKLKNIEKFKPLSPSINSSIKVLNKVSNKMSFFKLEANIQGELQSALWFILELFKIVFLFEPLVLFGALKQLDTKRKEMEDVFSFVGQIDSLLSIANLRAGLDSFCIPIIKDEEVHISASNIYHPLIEHCVTNNLEIKNKSILLTGSNMSGKTTFIRTVGLNIITGLSINTCFAESIIIPRTRLFSAIRISDDLMNDKSYYFEEVLTIKKMLDQSENKKPNLFLLDEIFKGTNTVERISAGKAVLSALAKNNNIVLVSTHDIELADLLADEYELNHFSEFVDDKNVNFDYKLKAGKLKNRNAIRILQINDYPESVTKEAMEIAQKLDNNTSKL